MENIHKLPFNLESPYLFKKILIVRFSSIGDLVLTTPVIRCLKKQTNCEIHLIVRKKFKEVLINNPYITRTWSVEKSGSELIEELRKESYDLIVDLHYNFRSIWLTWQLRVPFIRFEKLNIQKWLLTVMKINLLPEKHLVDRYFDSLKKIGILNDGAGLDYFISEGDLSMIEQFKLPEQYAVGIMGATYYTKQVPVNKWREILEYIPMPLVLLGGTAEKDNSMQLETAYQDKVFNYTGQLSVSQSAALIQKASFVITPDTGMMHIAAALRKPIHVIWGNTIPEFGMFPYFGNSPGKVIHHEVKGLKCRPCSKLGFNHCPKQHFDCMNKQVFNNKSLEI